MRELMPGEWCGVNSGGPIISKNGEPFSLPDELVDITEYLSVGDFVGYPTGQTFVITFVDPFTVFMRESGGKKGE